MVCKKVLLALCALSVADARVCRVLAMSGGGDRGSYEAGVLYALTHNLPLEEVRWDVVTGASVGTLNAFTSLFFEKGKERQWTEALHDLWMDITRKKVFKNWRFGIVEGATSKSGLFNTEPLRQMVKDTFKKLGPTRGDRALSFTTSDFTHGTVTYWNETLAAPDMVEAVMASTAIPSFFPAVKLGNNWHSDGGVFQNVDIMMGIERCVGPDRATRLEDVVVDIVVAQEANLEAEGKDLDKTKSFGFLMRMMNLKKSISTLRLIREAIQEFPEVQYRFLAYPDKLAGTSVSMDHKSIVKNYQHGLDDGKKIALDYLAGKDAETKPSGKDKKRRRRRNSANFDTHAPEESVPGPHKKFLQAFKALETTVLSKHNAHGKPKAVRSRVEEILQGCKPTSSNNKITTSAGAAPSTDDDDVWVISEAETEWTYSEFESSLSSSEVDPSSGASSPASDSTTTTDDEEEDDTTPALGLLTEEELEALNGLSVSEEDACLGSVMEGSGELGVTQEEDEGEGDLEEVVSANLAGLYASGEDAEEEFLMARI